MINNINDFKSIKNELTYIALIHLIKKRRYAYPSDKFCSVLAKLYQDHSDAEYYIPFLLEHGDPKKSGVLILRALQSLGLVRTWASVHTSRGIEQQAVPTDAGYRFLDDFLGKPKKRKPKDPHPIRRAIAVVSIILDAMGVIVIAGLEIFSFSTESELNMNLDNDLYILFNYVLIVTVVSLITGMILTHNLGPKQSSKDLMTKDLINRAIFRVREDKMLLYLINKGLLRHQLSYINQKTISVIDRMLFDP